MALAMARVKEVLTKRGFKQQPDKTVIAPSYYECWFKEDTEETAWLGKWFLELDTQMVAFPYRAVEADAESLVTYLTE